MKTLTKALLASLATSGLAIFSQAHAASVEVKWQDPEKYTDVRPTNESRVKFRERTFEALEKYLNKLADELPEKDKLAMTVTNLDLAGQVWPSSFVFGNATGSDVRIIKRVDIPRIAFSYSLTNSSGKVLKSADVNLKDMSFLDSPSVLSQSENLRYEKAMLKDWFEEEMADALVQN